MSAVIAIAWVVGSFGSLGSLPYLLGRFGGQMGSKQ